MSQDICGFVHPHMITSYSKSIMTTLDITHMIKLSLTLWQESLHNYEPRTQVLGGRRYEARH